MYGDRIQVTYLIMNPEYHVNDGERNAGKDQEASQKQSLRKLNRSLLVVT